jgi:transposase
MHRTGSGKNAAKTWKEWRRLRAYELHQKGWTQVLIANALGVTEAAVCQWLKIAEECGSEALLAKSREGQGAHLSEAQLSQLPAILDRGPESFGFLGALWTCPRIARVIEQEFGVRYHPDHVRRLLHRLDWTYQKPVLRASQRNEALISDWLTRVWPAIKKNAKKEGRTIVFVDESAFYLSPAVVKTWSPAGSTPEVDAPFGHEHLSVIGGMTLEGSLYVQIHRSSIGAHGAVEFVRHLLRHVPGRLLLLWDSARIHKSAELKDFRRLDTIQRLTIEYFPSYAPEVDPQEYVWHHLKHIDLRNLTDRSIDQLWVHLRMATKRLRARTGLLKSLTRHAGLDT